METGPRLKVSSYILVKPGIEPATPGVQGKLFSHYTTAAPIMGLDKQIFSTRMYVNIFLPINYSYVLGAQKNRLIETVLLSTHNKYVLIEK